MSFGSRLRSRREALGLKQSELGHLLGVTGSAVGNYETGVSSPKADILYRVFDALKCDANYLFQDEMRAFNGEESLTPVESELLAVYRSSNEAGREYLMNTARMVADNPAMQKEKGETASA